MRGDRHQRFDAQPQAGEARERHCRRCLALVERAEPEMFTRGEAEWLPRLDAEIDDLRSALNRSLHHKATLALRLAGLLELYSDIRNSEAEGSEWLDAALDAAGDDAPIAERAAPALRRCVSSGSRRDPSSAGTGRGGSEGARRSSAALSREADDRAGDPDALLGLATLEGVATLPRERRSELAGEALGLARQAVTTDRCARVGERALALPPAHGGVELDQAVAALSEIGSLWLLASFYSDIAYSWIELGRPASPRPLPGATRADPRAGRPSNGGLRYGNAGIEALLSDDLERARAGSTSGCALPRTRLLSSYEELAGLAAIAAAAARSAARAPPRSGHRHSTLERGR